VTFFALATAVAVVARRPWPDRLALVLSAVPIAVLANVARITASGAAFTVVTDEGWRHSLHDLTGWLMMPLALGLLWLELKLLDRLLLPAEESAPSPLHLAGTPAAADYARPRGASPLTDPEPKALPPAPLGRNSV